MRLFVPSSGGGAWSRRPRRLLHGEIRGLDVPGPSQRFRSLQQHGSCVASTTFRRRGYPAPNETHAHEFQGGDDAHVDTNRGVITARSIVVALPQILLWDTPDPYHYIRLQSSPEDGGGEDVLIVGGEDHKTGQANDAEERFARLEAWTRERFPQVQAFQYRWSGQVMEPVDGLAFIGRNPLDHPNVYVATGDSGNGMTHGTIAGMVISDLIAGRNNPWAELYDPSRRITSLAAARDFATEALNFVAQYSDLVTPGDVDEVSQIAPGQGAIVRRGVSKVAVYR